MLSNKFKNIYFINVVWNKANTVCKSMICRHFEHNYKLEKIVFQKFKSKKYKILLLEMSVYVIPSSILLFYIQTFKNSNQ